MIALASTAQAILPTANDHGIKLLLAAIVFAILSAGWLLQLPHWPVSDHRAVTFIAGFLLMLVAIFLAVRGVS